MVDYIRNLSFALLKFIAFGISQKNMLKNIYLLLFSIVIICSCNEKEPDNHVDNQKEEQVSLENYSVKIQSLVKSDSGVFRNIKFGTPIDFVRGIEDSTDLLENGENYINYTLHIDSLEDADVLYYFNPDNEVNKIEVDIYPDGEESRAQLYKEFTSYFNNKYGEPSSEIEEVKIWTVSDNNLKIEMRMLGNAKVHDLQIDFKEIEEKQDL